LDPSLFLQAVNEAQMLGKNVLLEVASNAGMNISTWGVILAVHVLFYTPTVQIFPFTTYAVAIPPRPRDKYRSPYYQSLIEDVPLLMYDDIHPFKYHYSTNNN